MIRLGILGCGAITKLRHLPTALAHPHVEVAALVDTDRARAETLKYASGVECAVSTSYPEIFGSVDAVINALPNHLHVAANVAALRSGVHVLCEKPLATDSTGARQCCAAAENEGRVLAMVMPRRFYESSRLLHMVLIEGLLGTVSDYDWEHGMPFEWRTASGFFFLRGQAGGGVLLDEGVHLLDLLIDWLGPVSEFRYYDDDWGSGIEANSILELEHNGRFGRIRGRLRLSRTYALKNRLLVRGDRAHAEITRSDPSSLVVQHFVDGQPVLAAYRLPEDNLFGAKNAFAAQLDNFVQAIEGKAQVVVDGRCALRTIELIEGCYAKRARIPEPWLEPAWHGATQGR